MTMKGLIWGYRSNYSQWNSHKPYKDLPRSSFFVFLNLYLSQCSAILIIDSRRHWDDNTTNENNEILSVFVILFLFLFLLFLFLLYSVSFSSSGLFYGYWLLYFYTLMYPRTFQKSRVWFCCYSYFIMPTIVRVWVVTIW